MLEPAAGVGLEMEPFALKQQFMSVGWAVTIGELGFGVGRVRERLCNAPGKKRGSCFAQSRVRTELALTILQENVHKHLL